MKAEIRKLIEVGNIEAFADRATGEMRLKVYPHKLERMSAQERDATLNAIKENKAAIIAELAEIEAEKEENKKHEHWFYACGWEVHYVKVDDRKDICEQCKAIAEQYDDLSVKIVADAYAKATGAKVETPEEPEKKFDEQDAEFRIIRADNVVQPSGREMGRDGTATLTMQHKHGEIVKMIERNVFDFGHYSYPERYNGTDDALTTDNWTDAEISACKWIAKYGVICKATRM